MSANVWTVFTPVADNAFKVFAGEVRWKIIKNTSRTKYLYHNGPHKCTENKIMTLFLVHTGPENTPYFPSEQEMLLQLSEAWFPALLLWQTVEYVINFTLDITHGNLLPTVGMPYKNPCDIASLYCGDLKSSCRARKNCTIICCLPITMLPFDTHTTRITSSTFWHSYSTTTHLSLMTNTAIETNHGYYKLLPYQHMYTATIVYFTTN
jgi:hypothetical protein